MKNKIKKICVAACSAAFLGLSGTAIHNVYNTNAESDLLFPQEYVIEKEYVYGQTFTVPNPNQVQIETGTAVSKAISVTLECPDGAVKSEGEYTLDKTGEYKLSYYNANGISATHTFVVNKKYYEVGGEASAKYAESLSCKEGTDGIALTLKSGESFTFNKPIDLNDYTNGVLDVCKIFPKFRKEYDLNPTATMVTVKVVDCFDPTKFVEFYVWCGSAGNSPYYAGAGASTQMLTGLEQNKLRPDQMTEEYDGEMYKIHRVRRYQSLSTYGKWLSSRYDAEVAKHDGVTLLWDLTNHQMKARNGGTTYLITDIDSTEIYGTNAFDFASFFTTGEVVLNVEAYNYAATSFDVEIESIFGMSGKDLLDGTVVDNTAPSIAVDVETTSDNEIYLQKGKAVTLPKVSSVLDYNYYGNEKVAVYRNYGKRGQVSVKVKDGAFTPETIGNYTAVYTATDSYGNKGEFLLDMVVLDQENIVYEKTPLNKLVAAQNNVIPYIQANGLNKEVDTEVIVTTPKGTQCKLDYNGDDGYNYLPEYAGAYTIEYLFKDNVYVEKYSYVVSCVDENVVAYKNPFKLPNYLMKGASYTIDPVTAYTAGNGGFNENTASISVSVDGGAFQPLSATQMQAYKVEANQTVQFKASYQNKDVLSKLYPVIDVGYGKKTTEKEYAKYMQGNYTSAELTDDGVVYSFENGTANMQFINAVSSTNFNLGFTLSASAVEDVTLTLRDLNAPDSNYITCTYQKEDGSNIMFVAKQYVDGKLVAEGEIYTKHKEWSGAYALSYSVEGLNVDDILVDAIKAFEKDDALLEIAIKGAKDCAVAVSQLNNQTFTTTVREGKPQISFEQKNGVQEVNGVYTIAPCYASSVLNSVLLKDVKVTVNTPNGDVATSVDGVRLENVTADRAYDVKLTQIGQYRVSYTVTCIGATRTNGQATLENDDYYIINVSEGIAPTVSFKDGSNETTTVKVAKGKTHQIKEFVATDNTTPSENLKVYKMILDEAFVIEANGYNVDSYTFTEAGTYIVYVLVYDALGNSAASYYKVIVS